MITLWYAILSFMLIVYVVLDGRNFGVGILHWFIAKTPAERRQVVAAIGPLWSWHEVWLVSFGGVLFVAFPRLLASAFSGYYLALFLILWSLILRGIALEVGGHIDHPLWQGFWDFILGVGSVLLAILFGAAAGNLLRGVPVDAHGDFHMAFFSDFGVRENVGILDWYTVSLAVFSTCLLAAHGATYLTLKTTGPLQQRSLIYARRIWSLMPVLLIAISIETWYVRPELVRQAQTRPLAWLGIFVILSGAIMLILALSQRWEKRALWGSSLLVIGLLATGAATLFPTLLYSTLDPQNSLTAENCASSHQNLCLAICWWPAALILSLAYAFWIGRYYKGKVSATEAPHGGENY